MRSHGQIQRSGAVVPLWQKKERQIILFTHAPADTNSDYISQVHKVKQARPWMDKSPGDFSDYWCHVVSFNLLHAHMTRCRGIQGG